MKDVPLARLLIVDDDSDQVEMSCRLLRAQGYLTIGVTSGSQAINVLRAAAVDETTKFDALITDLVMPVMDGITLLRVAHGIDEDLVSIVMTGHGTIDTAVEAMKSGALDYILKPFRLKVALPVLSRALSIRTLRVENTALRGQVEARTAALEASNRELKVANKELEAYAHSVSHDLRQPITNIIGFAEFIFEQRIGVLNEKQKEFFFHILDSGKKMLRLTEDLLRFSRLAQQPLQKQCVDMEALVWESIHTVQVGAADRNIECRVGALPNARADPALLGQVLVNLLSNAFKFTRHVPNSIIEVTGELCSGEARYCIRDNGVGFEMAKAQRLFSIFERMHSEKDFEGTGVGLSIVQRTIERHGGRIVAEAAVGEGAAFTLVLPT